MKTTACISIRLFTSCSSNACIENKTPVNWRLF